MHAHVLAIDVCGAAPHKLVAAPCALNKDGLAAAKEWIFLGRQPSFQVKAQGGTQRGSEANSTWPARIKSSSSAPLPGARQMLSDFHGHGALCESADDSVALGHRQAQPTHVRACASALAYSIRRCLGER
jgi:hypothetical protein